MSQFSATFLTLVAESIKQRFANEAKTQKEKHGGSTGKRLLILELIRNFLKQDKETWMERVSDVQHITFSDEYPHPLPYEVFLGSNLVSITLPPDMTVIPLRAFQGCENLKVVRGSERIREIQDEAFFGCISLDEIQLENLQTLDFGAFKNCKSLPDLDLPRVDHIKPNTFVGCEQLENVRVGKHTKIDLNVVEKGKLITFLFPPGTELNDRRYQYTPWIRTKEIYLLCDFMKTDHFRRIVDRLDTHYTDDADFHFCPIPQIDRDLLNSCLHDTFYLDSTPPVPNTELGNNAKELDKALRRIAGMIRDVRVLNDSYEVLPFMKIIFTSADVSIEIDSHDDINFGEDACDEQKLEQIRLKLNRCRKLCKLLFRRENVVFSSNTDGHTWNFIADDDSFPLADGWNTYETVVASSPNSTVCAVLGSLLHYREALNNGEKIAVAESDGVLDETDNVLNGVLAATLITSDDLWRHILEFILPPL